MGRRGVDLGVGHWHGMRLHAVHWHVHFLRRLGDEELVRGVHRSRQTVMNWQGVGGLPLLLLVGGRRKVGER